jgi:hypothetical protein
MKEPWTEKWGHAAARGIASVLWALGDRIVQGAAHFEGAGYKVREAGFWVTDQAIRHSERIHGSPPPGPPEPIYITKLAIPPFHLTEGHDYLNLDDAARVLVRSNDGLIERELPILDRFEGRVDLSGVSDLPVGSYEMVVDWGGKHQSIGGGIKLQDWKDH